MLVFIDESGDAGFKIDRGSSLYFIVTLVLFTDKEEALKADDHISEIRKQLGLHSDFEFHFHKTSRKFSTHFLLEICKFDFRYLSIVINKSHINAKDFHSSQTFYNFVCELAFHSAKQYLSQATVVIDGKNSKEFKTKLGNYLKSGINDKEAEKFHIKKVKMQDSAKNNLLQVADMVCGAVAKSFRTGNDDDDFRKIIREKEIAVEEFGDKK